MTLNDDAYVIPTAALDATTVAHLTLETPTYNIVVTAPTDAAAAALSPSQRPSVSAVIKDAVKTLNVLDVLAAAGVVKMRAVQSPIQAAPKPATPSPPTAAAAPLVKYRADSVPACPYTPEVGVDRKIVITEVISLTEIYVQVRIAGLMFG